MTSRTPVVEIIDPRVVEVLRRQQPYERLQQVDGLWELARNIVQAAVRSQHPEFSTEQQRREIAKRLGQGATARVP